MNTTSLFRCICILSIVQLSNSPNLAQNLYQTIRGNIQDKDTRAPLIGASVIVLDSDPLLGTTTDADGNFELNQVPVGRHQLECSYLGYETFRTEPFILNSARESFHQISLIESVVTTQEVVVRAGKFGNEPLNELSILSTRSFSVEETQRYPASANDPSRMAVGFPGVQPNRDTRSDIVIRGNSGMGMLWRLEGVDIPNPNHFARRGSSGGGITVFSVSMLGNSDFSTGAFPAEYGNATSGVFDIRFRKGDLEKRRQTFRAGMLGLDYSTEGPFKKNGNSSFLVNYRYSTLGILNAMGLHLVDAREDNTFQDLSFNLYFPSKDKKKILTIWGIGGISREKFNAEEPVESWNSYSDYYIRDFDSDLATVGLTYLNPAGKDAYLKTSFAVTSQRITFRNDTLNTGLMPFTVNDEAYTETRAVLTSFWNKKFNAHWSLKTGLIGSNIFYNLFWEKRGQTAGIDATGSTQLIQPFAQLRIRPNDRLTINTGIHSMYLTLNQDATLEPRISLKYQLNEKQHLLAAWGLHSKMLPLGNYFTEINGELVNLNANFLKAQHYVIGYEIILNKLWKFRAEIYHQRLWDVPVGKEPGSSWSILNLTEGFTYHALTNSGTGKNTGIDLSLEKGFKNGSFLLGSLSVFDSKYTDASGREFSTLFDSGYSSTLMTGKEWTLKKTSLFQIGTRALYAGGQRLTPLLSGSTVSRFSPNPILDESQAFSEQVQDYFRIDLRLAFRKNKTSRAWWIALDIQNVLAMRNIDALDRVYDPDLNAWVYRKQSSLTPILSFQLDW